MKKGEVLFSLLRIAIGLIFLWAFLDKLFGLNFATPPDKSWLAGVSPTASFLAYASKGTFSGFFHVLSGSIVVDCLYMAGLVAIGLSMIFGIFQKIAGYSGALMMALMYLSLFPSANNPLVDEHIVYLLLFLIFARGEAGLKFSLNKWWKRLSLTKKYSWLE